VPPDSFLGRRRESARLRAMVDSSRLDVAKLVDALTNRCPRLHVLATSRETLNGDALLPEHDNSLRAVKLMAAAAAITRAAGFRDWSGCGPYCRSCTTGASRARGGIWVQPRSTLPGRKAASSTSITQCGSPLPTATLIA